MSDIPDGADGGIVRDPAEYVNERRLKDIFDARNDLRDHRLHVQDAARENRFEALTAYRSAITNYIMEVEPLMHQYDEGTQLLYEHHFGSLTISPPIRTKANRGRTSGTHPVIDLHDGGRGMDTTAYPVLNHPDPVDYDLEGLDSLFTLDNPVRHEFTVTVKNVKRRNGHPMEETVTVTGQPAFDLLDGMARSVNRFLGQIGFELDTQTDDEWHIAP